MKKSSFKTTRIPALDSKGNKRNDHSVIYPITAEALAASAMSAWIEEAKKDCPTVVEPGFYTSKQIQEALGRNIDHVSRWLRQKKKEGVVEMKMFTIANGSRFKPTPHYRLKNRSLPIRPRV